MGLLVLIGSIGTAVQTTLSRTNLSLPFVEREQVVRVASFVGPIVLFVAAALWLGLYVSGALYLTLSMWLQGGYRPLVSLATGIAAAVFFYLVLELAFQVPLLKGPLEAAIGLS
jgi:Tripartite tricarboxylate transporter TctB family